MDPFGFRSPYQYHHPQPPYQPAPQRGLGILQRLFSRNQGSNFAGENPPSINPNVNPNFFMHNSIPYQATSTTSSSGLLNTLNTVQKGLGVVQQVTPLVKQYAPFVKNLPMLIDMMKIMMEDDDEVEKDENEELDSSSEEKKDENSNNENKDKKSSKSDNKKDVKREQTRNTRKKVTSKKSDELPKPKMYI